jgi:hypothetical protein
MPPRSLVPYLRPAEAHHQGLREPVREIFRPFDGENKIFLGVDLVEPVDRRQQKRNAGFGVLEPEFDVRLFVQPSVRGDDAVFEAEPPPDALVARHDLSDEIVLLDAPVEMRMPL